MTLMIHSGIKNVCYDHKERQGEKETATNLKDYVTCMSLTNLFNGGYHISLKPD